jgi:hypothetical protein
VADRLPTDCWPAGEDPPIADTPMWLSHHWPVDYDRCAVVAGRHVCRRCLWMYPVAIVAAFAAGAGLTWPSGLDAALIFLLPLPAVVDFVLDNLGRVRYSARRQAILSAVGAVGAGKGYVRYLDDHTDPVVWSIVAIYVAICVAAAVLHSRSRRAAARVAPPR